MNFEFATAGRIIFGAGKRNEALGAARAFGARGLLVTGASPARASWLKSALDLLEFVVAGEPSVEKVSEGARVARESGAEFVIAIGGGSVMDAGKAIAALGTNTAPPLEYLEVIGSARPLREDPLPLIALPTTAGTGAEVTRNAVLGSAEHRVKVSLRSPKMLPPVAIVDPELTFDLPPALTATTGMDALTQLIEPFLCNRANPLTDAICREAIPRAARALPRAFANGQDREARIEMALASLCGGLALANAGLGAVHGLAAPIGGMFDAPHGAVCAALLPEVLGKNFEALRQRAPDSPALKRYDQLGSLLLGNPSATGREAISFVHDLQEELNIAGLRAYGIRSSDLPEIAERGLKASSMKANPIGLTTADLIEILEGASA